MKVKPFGNQILIKPIEKKQVLVADKASLCEYGKVIAIGSEVKDIKVDDVIGFLIWGINSLEIDDEKYYFIQEDPNFVLGTVEM